MTLNTFKKILLEAIENTEGFVIYDTETDKDFAGFEQIKNTLTHVVVAGEDEKEVFCLSIIKVR